MSSPSNPGRDSNAQSAPLNVSLCMYQPSSSSPVHVFFCGSSVNTSVNATLKERVYPKEICPFSLKAKPIWINIFSISLI